MYAYLIHHAPHPVWGLETRGVFGMRRERWVESARLVCAGQVLGRSRRFKVDGRSGILAVDRMPDEECGGSTVGREGKSRYAVKVYVAPCFRRPVLNGAMASGEWHRVDCDFDGLIESWEVVVSDEPVDIAAHMREVGFREVERGSFRLERDFSNEWPKDCGRIQTLDDAPPNGIWHVAATMIRKLLASSQMPTQWRPNPVCSPYCCDEIFDIVQHGSAGGTRHRLATVRGAANSQREIDSAGADAVAAAHGLRHVSGVWVGQEAHPDEAFLAYCTSKGIPVDAVDFTDPRASQRIADFIKNGTRGMMRPPITVTKDTLAYVASTLWFKDAWKDEFDQRNTAAGNFHMGDGVVVQTDFMHNTINGMIVDYADCVAASLPFKHGGRMVFVLPDQDVELESLIRNGHLVAVLRSYAQMMADGTWQMASGEIRFGVPRFAAESIYERLEQSLGLGGRCDMTPMTGSDDCEIAMVHGAKIIVNEQGAEASAYAMTYAVTGAPASVPRPFTLNRPFAYMIVTDDGMPLFVGLVRDSTA